MADTCGRPIASERKVVEYGSLIIVNMLFLYEVAAGKDVKLRVLSVVQATSRSEFGETRVSFRALLIGRKDPNPQVGHSKWASSD